MNKEKKLVVWDLDNTVWDGIIAEGDTLKLKPEVPNIMKELDERGILQSVASKNNFDDGVESLMKFDLYHYFVYPQINWNPKSENIKQIISDINISADTVVFIDDQVFERNEVQHGIPEITCIDAVDINMLLERADMNPKYITQDSKMRRSMYQSDIKRNKAMDDYKGVPDDFLATLDMHLCIAKATKNDLLRAAELTVRTNQLNSTGYTYSLEELADLMNNESYELLVAELTDKYGQYGKIGLALLHFEGDSCVLKLLLTSCRTMSYGIGSIILATIINRSISNKKDLYAEFVPTARNKLMAVTYSMMRFQKAQEYPDKQILKYVGDKLVSTSPHVKITELH